MTADVGSTLNGVSSIMWPIVAMLLAVLFRGSIRALLQRLLRIRLPGGVEADLEKTSDAMAVLDPTSPTVVDLSLPAAKRLSETDQETQSQSLDKILTLTAENPRVGLVAARQVVIDLVTEVLPPGDSRRAQPFGSGADAYDELTLGRGQWATLLKRFDEVTSRALKTETRDTIVINAVQLGLRLIRNLTVRNQAFGSRSSDRPTTEDPARGG